MATLFNVSSVLQPRCISPSMVSTPLPRATQTLRGVIMNGLKPPVRGRLLLNHLVVPKTQHIAPTMSVSALVIIYTLALALRNALSTCTRGETVRPSSCWYLAHSNDAFPTGRPQTMPLEQLIGPLWSKFAWNELDGRQSMRLSRVAVFAEMNTPFGSVSQPNQRAPCSFPSHFTWHAACDL